MSEAPPPGSTCAFAAAVEAPAAEGFVFAAVTADLDVQRLAGRHAEHTADLRGAPARSPREPRPAAGAYGERLHGGDSFGDQERLLGARVGERHGRRGRRRGPCQHRRQHGNGESDHGVAACIHRKRPV